MAKVTTLNQMENCMERTSDCIAGAALAAAGAIREMGEVLSESMTGATASKAGKSGMVPAPVAGAQAKFLRGDGTWQSPTDTNDATAQNISTANNTYPILLGNTANATANIGNKAALFGSGVKVNPSTSEVIATKFTGALTGNVTGNCSGSSGSCTGNAATATKLATARTINIQDSSATNTGTGASFDGSGNATIKLPAIIKADVTGNCSGSSGSCTGNAATASKATQLTTARTIDGVSFNGTANITHYGSCSTAAATAEKAVACTGFALATGAEINVKFTVTNTAANPTLNVSSTGAKAIYYRGAAISAGYLAANRTYRFVYNGAQYELIGDLDTNTNNATAQNISTTNATYPILLGNTANATANIGNKAALFGAGVKVNPSTSEVIATKFIGALKGKALSAAAADNAAKVNNLTVETAVPANAKFTDTTYSNMTGATANAAGKAGLVPAPAAGAQAKFLRGDGSWANLSDTVFVVSTSPQTGNVMWIKPTD